MLSPQSAEVVRATLPTVTASIGEISHRFYQRMFSAHPELLRDLFNRGNQADGSQQQALAGAVAAFAGRLLDRPGERPDALLARIAHKHVSLGITPDQYPLVRRHLFDAIGEVLGEAAPPQVVRAWDEVYWLMAGALISLEGSLYAQAGVPAGEVWRRYRVTARVPETQEATTFQVTPADDRPLPASRAGQYVSVAVELPDGARQIRQYSLSGRPDGALQFTVKRATGTPAGEVSGHLHDRIDVGDDLLISTPCGDVTLEAGEAPVLLASAGIGCTPLIGMLADLAADGATRRVLLAHADRSFATHAFRTDLYRLAEKLPHAETHVWYEEPGGAWPADRTGRPDLRRLAPPADTVAYLCGPVPFLRAARAQLLECGLAASALHYEVFGPDLWLGSD